jgi:hypothetical protein
MQRNKIDIMQEENFSEQDSLKLINEMIGKAKKSYVTKGIASIVWGALITFCGIFNWAEIHYNVEYGDVWVILLLALIPQVYFSIKERSGKSFIAHNETTILYIWIAFSVSIFITTNYFERIHMSPIPIIMMLYAIPTFLIGAMQKFVPMILGGVFCWIASIISIFTGVEIDMILMAACGLFAWLIPGIILWKQYKKNQVANV